MERKSLIKNLLSEGLNIPKQKKPEIKQSNASRLIDVFRNDLNEFFPDVFPQVFGNGPKINFYDSVHQHGRLTIELYFSLVRGADSIKIKYNVYNPSFMPLDTGVEMFDEYMTKVKKYHEIAEFIREHFYVYEDAYREIKKGTI